MNRGDVGEVARGMDDWRAGRETPAARAFTWFVGAAMYHIKVIADAIPKKG